MGQPATIPGAARAVDALDQLLKLKSRLLEKLAHNSDYRALTAIERAIAELDDEEAGERPTSSGRSPTSSPSVRRSPASNPSHAEAVAQVLGEVGHPLAMRELIGRLRQEGIRFVGKDPKLSLSATLSRSQQFRSVSYEGDRCWWFADRPLPNERASRDHRHDIRLPH